MMTRQFSLHTHWVSAFIDGETSLSEQGSAFSSETGEAFYYYTLTRQVVRGEPCLVERHDQQQQRWSQLWARIDAHSKQSESI